MFSRMIVCAFLAFFLAGLATASPLPMPLQFGRRGGLGPVDTIEVYRRESVTVRDHGIQFLPRQIPTEQPVKSPSGTIEPYRRTIPEEVAVKADTPGNIVQYREAPTVARRASIPVESPVKATTPGDIVPY